MRAFVSIGVSLCVCVCVLQPVSWLQSQMLERRFLTYNTNSREGAGHVGFAWWFAISWIGWGVDFDMRVRNESGRFERAIRQSA